MKKIILLCIATWIAMPICFGAYSRLLFSSLYVKSDGSWNAMARFGEFQDTLLVISGTDTAQFTFTEAQMEYIMKNYDLSDEFNVYGDQTSTKLTIGLSDEIYESKPLKLSQQLGSIQVTIFNNGRSFYHDNESTVKYGGNYFLPAFTDDQYLELNLRVPECYSLTIGTARLVKSGRAISPYVLRGKVYDSRGLLVKSQSFTYTMYNSEDNCFAGFETSDDGSFVFDIITAKNELTGLSMRYYSRTFNIQPITLGKPFGDTVNVDIHLLGPLAEGEDAPEAIAVQRSGSILHVSGAVREIALIDAGGRSLSYTRSADMDIEQLPAGIYYLSVTLDDGRTLRHPFNK